MADLATLIVNLRGDVTGLRQSVNKAEGVLGGLRKTVVSLGGVFAGAFAVRQIGQFIAETSRLADEQAKAEQKVKQGIIATGKAAGFSANELFKVASELQKLTRFGDEEILNQVTAQFLTFKNITGETFLRAQKAALDLSTVLDGDLKSASIQLGKALNDPVTGVTALTRVGVSFTEQQKEQIKTLAETNRLVEAQGIVLAELEGQYGGQAEAAAKAGKGGIVQLQNAFNDLKEQIGGVVNSIINALVPALTDLIDRAGKLGKALGSLRSEWQLYKDTYPGFFKTLSVAGEALAAVLITVKETISILAKDIADIFVFLGDLIDAALNPRETLVGAWDKFISNLTKSGETSANNVGKAWSNVWLAAQKDGEDASIALNKGVDEYIKKIEGANQKLKDKTPPALSAEIIEARKKQLEELADLAGKVALEEDVFKIDIAASISTPDDKDIIKALGIPDPKELKDKVFDQIGSDASALALEIAKLYDTDKQDEFYAHEAELVAQAGELADARLAQREQEIEQFARLKEGAEIAFGFINQLGDALVNTMFTAGTSLKDFASVLKDWAVNTLRQLAAVLIKAVLVAAVLSFITGGADKVAGFGKILQGVFSGNLGGLLPGAAEGGIVTKPTVLQTGEAGPEAIIPLDKLDRFIKPQQAGGQLVARVSGQDLLFILNEAERRQSNTL